MRCRSSLQWHFRAGSGPTYLFLHLWNFTIQVSYTDVALS